MSGGHFNYDNYNIGYTMDGQWQDEEINELFNDLFVGNLWGQRSGGLAGALDYWLADDISEETYREYVDKFKKKWFHRTPSNRVEFYQNKLQDYCDKLKKELGDI